MPSRDARGRLAMAGIVFCISGVSALVYQVAWQRILVLHSGVGIYSVAVIVAAFMLGLGVGSYAGGRFTSGMQPARALRAFAAIEIAIGLFALVSCPLYYQLLYGKGLWMFRLPVLGGIVHISALFVPTFLMGMSLPFLAHAMVGRFGSPPRIIGFLYGINAIGAAAGALLTPWLLIRSLGVQGAVYVGATGNLVAGLTALAIGAGLGETSRSTIDTPESDAEPAGERPFGLWLGLYTLSGFCALSFEILWFRIIDVAVKSTAFTFGTVLAVFLFGLGVGSTFGGSRAERVKRPLDEFLICQSILFLSSGLSVCLLVYLPANTPILSDLVGYWGQYDEFRFGSDWNVPMIVALYVALPVFLYGVPTLLMGYSFAILQRAVQDDVERTGLRVGLLQAGNILGNVLGTLLTGLWLLNLIGTAGSLKLLLTVGLIFPVLALQYSDRRRLFGALTVTLMLVAIITPDARSMWSRFHGGARGAILVEEDATLLVAIRPEQDRLQLSVNGKGHSWLPYGGVHSMLGALPALVHPAPYEVAIIGLGSGDSAWAASCREQTRNVTVFELGAPEKRLLERLDAQMELPTLTAFLTDARVQVVTADGRNALALSEQKYDVIEADALRPRSAFSGNIYSLEFFRLCGNRLKPGGLMCTWAPTPRIHDTFVEAFPYVLEFDNGNILIGSNEPLQVDPSAWQARLDSVYTRRHLGAVRDDLQRALNSVRAPRDSDGGERNLNRDLFPRDEFRSAQ